MLQRSAFFPLTDAAFASWPIPYFLGEPRNATTAPDALFGHALSCNRNAQVQTLTLGAHTLLYLGMQVCVCGEQLAAALHFPHDELHHNLPSRQSLTCHRRHLCTPYLSQHLLFGYLQGALLLPALRYAENGTFTINFWQRVHRRFPDASQYMLSHQSLLPADVNASAWGPDQVWKSSDCAATLSAICWL